MQVAKPKLIPIGTILAKNARTAVTKARAKYPGQKVYMVRLMMKEYRSGLNLYKVLKKGK
jgi:hypothetical protein